MIYNVMRGWRDGEPMTQHLMAEFDDLDAAINYSRVNGGYVQRIADGAILPARKWIDAETGSELDGDD